MVKAATRIAAITNILTTMHVWQVEPRIGVCFDRVSIMFLLWFVSWLAVPRLADRSLYKSYTIVALRYGNFTSVS